MPSTAAHHHDQTEKCADKLQYNRPTTGIPLRNGNQQLRHTGKSAFSLLCCRRARYRYCLEGIIALLKTSEDLISDLSIHGSAIRRLPIMELLSVGDDETKLIAPLNLTSITFFSTPTMKNLACASSYVFRIYTAE